MGEDFNQGGSGGGQAFGSRAMMLPVYQMVSDVYAAIYNGAREVGEVNQNMLPRQKEALAATKRLLVFLILQMNSYANDGTGFTQKDIDNLYKKNIEMLMIDASNATRKAKMIGYIESSATSFYEGMMDYKKQQKQSGQK